MPLRPLDRESEPYSQYGNISADGIQRLLGTPHLDSLQLLIRETVQNSWDAGKLRSGTVHYKLRFRTLSPEQRDVLRTVVFGDLPRYDRSPKHSIANALKSEQLTVVEICDFGTGGLGGPTNPEEVPEEGTRSDFVDFLRNIGSPRNTDFGGGTYGYGKSCLYAMSRCRAVIVDSVPAEGAGSTRRLMGCRVASRYDIADGDEQGRYTGRHWWGRRNASSVLEPVTDDEARHVSEALGMHRRGDGDYGTSILVLEPDLDCADLREAATRAAGVLLAYCWPKMVADDRAEAPPMTFSVEVNGEEVPLPHPDQCPPLNLFANALRAVRAARENVERATEIRSGRPRRHLGYLRIERDVRRERASEFGAAEYSPFPEACSHVALMRPVELVVKYIPGEPLPSDKVEWAGVFVCAADQEVEQAFAAAEPPAHDDWDPQSLPKGPGKTFVNVALRRIREEMSKVAAHQSARPSADADTTSLGQVAEDLGSMLARRIPADGKPRQHGSSRRQAGRGGGVRLGVSSPQFIGHEIREGRAFALFEVRMTAREPVDVVLSGKVRILKEGGGADTEDALGRECRVWAWRLEDGSEVSGPSMETSIDGERTCVAVATMPEGKAISLVPEVERLE